MLDVQKLVVLRAVVAHGSIAAAGRELGYTRSAISQQVSALERAAGTALLVRSGNSFTVTPVCRQLLEHTERVLIEIRAAEATLRRTTGEVAGTLRAGVPFREGPAVMSSALTSVRLRHPQLVVTLGSTTSVLGPEALRHGRFDVVLLSRYGVAPGTAELGLKQWVLGHDALRLCVPAGHRLAGRSSCSIAELEGEDWVLSPASPLGQLTTGLCAAAGFSPSLAASVDDVGTALGLVTVGWGITVAPELTPSGAGPAISRIALEGVGASRHSVLLVRDGDQESPAIAAVVAAVRRTSTTFDYH